MADLTAARPIARYGDPNAVLTPIYGPIGIDANTLIYGGGLVGTNSVGNMVKADAASCLFVAGVARKNYFNRTTDPSGGAAGAVLGEIVTGAFPLNISTDGGAITNGNRWQDVYVVDDNTVSLSDSGGTRLRAGFLLAVDTLGGPTNGLAWVQVGVANPALAAAGGAASVSAAGRARAVVTTLQAYTGSGTGVLTETSNGAISAADGVTLAVGDVVFIPETTTNLTAALDAGPWSVTSLGGASAKWVLTRPSWYEHGETMPLAMTIEIGGEGTAWAGHSWRSFAAKGSIVDTTAPAFYPRTQQVTTGAMTAGVSAANSTLWVFGAQTIISAIPITPGGTQGTLRISTRTAGLPGTSSVVVTSSSNTDTSTVQIQVENF